MTAAPRLAEATAALRTQMLPVAALHTVPADEFCGTELPPIEWLVPRFVSRGGFTIFYGAPKAGKTTLAYHLAGAVASGGVFLGWRMPAQPVLLLDLEQPRRLTQRALHKANARGPNLHVYRGAPPTLESVMATIRALDTSLVVVDSLSRWLEVESESDNAEITRRLAPILRAFQELDVALLTIHLYRKSEGDNGRNMRGGTAYLASCDTAIEVRRVASDESDPRRQLRFTSREEPQPSITVKLEADAYVEEAAPALQREQRVLQALQATELTAAELAVAIGESERVMRDWMQPLTSRGKVVVHGKGVRGDPIRYALPDYSGDRSAGNPRNSGIGDNE